MKKIVYLLLKVLAKLTIAKYKPKVIAVTGSVGKTSTKEAIFCVLQNNFRVYHNTKNYNNELGVPLVILGYENSPAKNIFKWWYLIHQSIRQLFEYNHDYPEILILEMGADRLGDIKYLTSIVKPHIAVITAIGLSHLKYFKTIENITSEKISILDRLHKEDWAIINNDDENLKGAVKKCKCSLITFGRGQTSDVNISNVHISKHNDKFGTSFKLGYQGSETPMFLPLVLGWQHAQAAAAAAAVGLALGMNLVKIGERLAKYVPVKGRTNLLSGIKDSLVIDDTYNASPESAKVALEVLAEMPTSGRRIAIFGAMLELGEASRDRHWELGQMIVEKGIDILFVFGDKARNIARGAKQAGMSEDRIFKFDNVIKAGHFTQEKIREGDIILVKGSRGAKMEQMVYELMARPWEADEVLVAAVTK